MKLRLPVSVQNWISLIGATIALISFFMIVFLFTITAFFLEGTSYMGLVVYILLPAVLITGLILIPVGMIINIQRRKKSGEIPKTEWPQIDLNNISHRNAFIIFSIGTTIFLFISAVGSYEAFHFTESVQFCGTICHNVMNPEYTAYQNSSHARVTCVECHVGKGADWYVKSKISGMYQVYAVLANVFPKPIPTPVENLRPARETCEQCHWPQKFYPYKLRTERHFLTDENNTQWDIRLTMKIGSDHSALGLKEGIHWHINPDVRVEFISADKKEAEIQWIRYTNIRTGEQKIFQNNENPIDENEIIPQRMRTMDCMDCHNRPSHSYRPPAFFVNEAITAGDIPVELPQIKALAMDLCEENYSTTDSAMQAIRKGISDFYEENFPEIVTENPAMLEKAITGLQKAFVINIFPEMNVKWSAYPNHIGHMEFNGCFRCHNDSQVDETGKAIGKDCNLCHTITAQGTPENMEYAVAGGALEFKHPEDIGDEWKENLCTECHTGLNP